MNISDDQELLVLKQFIKKYGRLGVGLFVFFVIVLFGGNYWQRSKASYAKEASQIFQDMVIAEIQHDTASATAKGGQLISDYSNSPYAQFAGLLLAKMAVAEGNLDKAVEKLQVISTQRGAANIAKHLATVRLAAILQQQGKLDEALKLVGEDQDKAYTALYAQARGDIYVAKGDLEQAKKAYMLAIQSLPDGVQSQILQLKLVDLGGDEDA